MSVKNALAALLPNEAKEREVLDLRDLNRQFLWLLDSQPQGWELDSWATFQAVLRGDEFHDTDDYEPNSDLAVLTPYDSGLDDEDGSYDQDFEDMSAFYDEPDWDPDSYWSRIL